jgi:inhibitor of KinA sporulation pathway (predicted exonuclease)
VPTVVVDVEATCWPDDQPELRQRQREISEIIEIGAVRLRGPALELDGEYQAFVRPIAHATLSPFCVQLTSITQEQVDASPTFPGAWAAFRDWLAADDELVMASWSAYDDHLFRRQALEHEQPPPPWVHLDIKAEFGRWVFGQQGSRKRFRLSAALAHTGLEVEGTAHRAIDDARNTATLLRHIRDPRRAAPLALHALRHIRDRHPKPTHQGHLKEVLPRPKVWYPRVRHELARMGLVHDLGAGKGLTLTEHGLAVVPTLGLDDLPEAVDPDRRAR